MWRGMRSPPLSAEALALRSWHGDPVSAPPQTQHHLCHLLQFRAGFPHPKPLMMALCSGSASVGRVHLPTAFFTSSVPCVSASPGLAQHLTSCRAGPGCVCSASVSPPTAAESLGLLPVCTCKPPWHCPCPTGPCPSPRHPVWHPAHCARVCSLPDHGSLAPGPPPAC